MSAISKTTDLSEVGVFITIRSRAYGLSAKDEVLSARTAKNSGADPSVVGVSTTIFKSENQALNSIQNKAKLSLSFYGAKVASNSWFIHKNVLPQVMAMMEAVGSNYASAISQLETNWKIICEREAKKLGGISRVFPESPKDVWGFSYSVSPTPSVAGIENIIKIIRAQNADVAATVEIAMAKETGRIKIKLLTDMMDKISQLAIEGANSIYQSISDETKRVRLKTLKENLNSLADVVIQNSEGTDEVLLQFAQELKDIGSFSPEIIRSRAEARQKLADDLKSLSEKTEASKSEIEDMLF